MNLIELFRMINKQQTDSNTQEEKIFQYIREVSALRSNFNSALKLIR